MIIIIIITKKNPYVSLINMKNTKEKGVHNKSNWLERRQKTEGLQKIQCNNPI